ncbi:MAG: hypothetical protein EP346_00250 [Bacteroidetes bacterium]|nr:MAG: hypothetical protein EP346_00250 [Bacteroidota bacterium]
MKLGTKGKHPHGTQWEYRDENVWATIEVLESNGVTRYVWWYKSKTGTFPKGNYEFTYSSARERLPEGIRLKRIK